MGADPLLLSWRAWRPWRFLSSGRSTARTRIGKVVHRAVLTTMVFGAVACGSATRPTQVVRIAPSASASSAPASVLAFDPSLTVVHRESIQQVSKPDHADRVFALAADGTTLVAIDTRTGAETWRSALSIAKDERVSIYPDFGAKRRVLVHAGYELVFVDPDSGTVVARAEALRNFKSVNDIVSTAEEPYGACVVYAACSMQPFDCDDGHRIGPQFERSKLHVYRSLGGPHDTVCRGREDVVGRSAGVVVVITEAEESPVLKGVDAKSGAIAWSRKVTCHDCSRGPSGVSADGSTCWISGGGELEAFACATGRTVFTHALTSAKLGPEVLTAAVRGGIFVSDAASALVLDPKTGRPVWSKKLDPGALGLPLGTKLDLPEFSTWGAHTVVLLDPEAGREAARFAQPAYVEVRQGADLGLRLEGGPAFDARGVKQYDLPPATFVVNDGSLVAPDGTVVAHAARSIEVVDVRSSNGLDVVTFEAWTEGRLDLLVARRGH